MIGIIALSLSLLVILSGLYLLSKSKKDGLGNLYIFSSYTAILLGGLLFAGTVVGGAMMMRHHHKGQCSSYMSSCKSGNACTSMGSCTMNQAQCGMNKAQCGNSSYHHKASCGAGAPACGAHQMHGKHHGAMMHHKRMHPSDNDAGNVEIEVEVEEVE